MGLPGVKDPSTVEPKRCAYDPMKTYEDMCSVVIKILHETNNSEKWRLNDRRSPSFFRIAGLSHGHSQLELLQVPAPFEALNTKQGASQGEMDEGQTCH